MKRSILGNHFLPENEQEFNDLLAEGKYLKVKECLSCSAPFSGENTHTTAGWKETQISGFCENCFDEVTKEMDEEDDNEQAEGA